MLRAAVRSVIRPPVRSPMLVASALARRRLVTLVVATTMAAVPLAGPQPTPAEAATPEECLSRPADDQTATGSGTRDQLRQPSVPDGHTFDLRGTTFLGQQDTSKPDVNLRPINLGADSNPSGLCVVGGFVKGTHGRDLGWEHFKSDPGGGDGEALRIAGSGPTLVNGLRVDNMMNGFRPLTDGIEVRNSYFNYVRDDCVENDDLRAVRIVDSLWDGCFTVFSQRPGSASAVPSTGPRDTSLLEIERVLVRMYPMPGGHQLYDASLESFGKLWKWSDVAGPAVIRDSIIMAEDRGDKSMGNSLDWPSNVTAENVTIVWAGSGSYPGKLPASGVTVTKDTSVWWNARADWLARHGCTDIDNCDPDKLIAPDGAGTPPSSTTSPEPTPTTEPAPADPTSTATAPVAPVVSATVTDQGVELSWDGVEGASWYKVQRDAGALFHGQRPVAVPLQADAQIPGHKSGRRCTGEVGDDPADRVALEQHLGPPPPLIVGR